MSHFGALSRLFFKAEVDICLQLMQYPDAPCMDYFPTLREQCPHSRGNVRTYYIFPILYGASGLGRILHALQGNLLTMVINHLRYLG